MDGRERQTGEHHGVRWERVQVRELAVGDTLLYDDGTLAPITSLTEHPVRGVVRVQINGESTTLALASWFNRVAAPS